MRLYLSSYRLGRAASEIMHGRRTGDRVGIIQNAQDCWTDPAKRRSVLERECADMRSLGLAPEELDLRQFFGRPDDLSSVVAQCKCVWVLGGNSFVLGRAFSLSGFDAILTSLASDAGFTYGGYSAGACVMTPTLEGIHLADDPTSNPDGYSGQVLWAGLGIYPYCIAPHFRSDHYESALIEKSVEYFIQRKLPFIALKDGEAISFDTLTGEGVVVGAPA